MFFRKLALLLAFLWVAAIPLSAQAPAATSLESPLVFEANHGQTASTVRFLSHGNGHSFLLKDTEAVLSFANPSLTVRMKLVGQNPHPAIEGIGRQPGFTNYYHGNDPAQWLKAIPNFEKVRYTAVYPGIDMIYYGSGRQLEYDFEIQPLSDPSTIQIEFEGVSGISVAPDGDLILSTSSGEIRHRRPVAFQRRGALQDPVAASFIVRDRRVGFAVGRYDRSRPLIIDPTLVWSSYLGGTGNDQGNDVALDSDGNVYVTGFTQDGATFSDEDPPPVPTLVPDPEKRFEGFVTKLSPSGSVIYSTYFGGTPPTSLSSQTVDDEAHSLALDGMGHVFVVGYTFNNNFPIVDGFQTTPKGAQEAYIVRLDSGTGTLQFSSYLGGSQSDRAFGVAVDADGSAYVAGSTLSLNFPVLNAFQPKFGEGLRDVFLTKVTVAGTIGFSTYLGGFGDEQAYDVAVDSAGNIVLTGYTTSLNFPTSHNLFSFRGGQDDIFITKFNPTGNALVFSTYWGGSGSDNGVRLAIDKNDVIYVTGTTASGIDFPLKNPAQLINAGLFDAFLIKLEPDGQTVDFSTFIGAEDTDSGTGVAVDNNGSIYVTGFTNSLGFFAINAVGGFLRGARDAFMMKLSSDASVVFYSTYLGGFGVDGGTSIAVDSAGDAYVTGFTTSTSAVDISLGFPVTKDAFQSKNAGLQDGFIIRLNADDIKSSTAFAFPAKGGASTATAGQTAQPVFGYASVEVTAGSSPSGVAIIDLRSSGTLLNEVSLPIPFPTPSGQVYATTSLAGATALTMVNRSDEEASITVYFTPNGGGGAVLTNTFTLAGHAQLSGFLYADPFRIPIDQVGTLVYTSTTPLSTVALRAGSSGSPVNVYLPIINLNLTNDHKQTIPQFADGGGWSGQIYLVNPMDVDISGEIRFYKAGLPGEPGVPVEMATDKGTLSVVPYSIAPHESFFLSTHSEGVDITAAFADVVPADGASAPLAYAILNFAENGFLAVTVEAVEAASEFKMYAEITGKFPEALGTMPALALANSADTPATVTLKMIGFDGADSGLSSTITLPPKGHYSRFLNEIPGFEELPHPFLGVLYATTSDPGVTFAGFRTRYNEQGQFTMTATGPLKAVGSGPVIFPHLVDGGGYATQFILINGEGSSGAVGTIRYLDQLGNPLNVALAP
jgi:Beta-propeller repeat